MSSAWFQLKRAVHILSGDGPPRERLFRCYTSHLATLRPKDLPAEIRNEFSSLAMRLNPGPEQSIRDVRQAVEVSSDEDVMSMIHSIVEMYDAVTRYQPLPGECHKYGRDKRSDRRNVPD